MTGISNGYGNDKIHLETHAGGDYINKGTDWIENNLLILLSVSFF